MKVLVVGKCAPESLFSLVDPSAPNEDSFTQVVVTTLSCVFPKYQCVPFAGRFHHDEHSHKPDLALVARDRSHWYVIEVELVTHSLFGHVIPQVQAFRHGDPGSDCAARLSEQLEMPLEEAKTLVRYVPRSVVVVANRRTPEWESAIRGAGAQLVVVSRYISSGQQAVELDGQIEMASQSLGFGSYVAVDRAVRFHRSTQLADGDVQLDDSTGTAAMWKVSRANDFAWVTRSVGEPDFQDRAVVQLLRMFDGRLVLRMLEP